MFVYHNVTVERPVLKVWNEFWNEIAAESLTRGMFDFVHREIWMD